MTHVTTAGDALEGKWRRLNARVDDLWPAMNQTGAPNVRGATAAALVALYAMWEYWKQVSGRTNAQIDYDIDAGDDDGKIDGGIAWARGETIHSLIEFGSFEHVVASVVYNHFGAWMWQRHSSPSKPQYAKREAWYAAHVARHEVLVTSRRARNWFERQPELQLPATQ